MSYAKVAATESPSPPPPSLSWDKGDDDVELKPSQPIPSRSTNTATVIRWARTMCHRWCGCCFRAPPIPLSAIPLSKVQHERLVSLRSRLAISYDPTDDEHSAQLIRLGAAAFDDQEFKENKSARWKTIGFQGEDPATDFRAGGLYALQNLLYFVHTQRPAFIRCTTDAISGVGGMAEHHLPWACAGINLTFTLSHMLCLRRRPFELLDAHEQRVYRCFLTLLSSDEYAFEELFSAFFLSLLDRWRQRRARYMDFSIHVAVIRTRIELVMMEEPQPETLRQFHRRFADLEIEEDKREQDT